MPPVPVLSELVMVVPATVSELLFWKFRTLVLPTVRLLMVSLTLSCTVEPDVVIKALLPEPGTVPNDHDVAVPQLPDPLSQLSELIAGWTNGWKPEGTRREAFSQNYPADSLLPEIAHGLYGARLRWGLRIKSGAAKQKDKQVHAYL